MLLRQMVDYLAEYPFQCRYHSLIKFSLCSGVAVMFSVKPASPSLETSNMPPGMFAIPVELPKASHPHSTHMLLTVVA